MRTNIEVQYNWLLCVAEINIGPLTESPSSEALVSRFQDTEDNNGTLPYCVEKLKGTCETNEDNKRTITTTVSQAKITDLITFPISTALQSDLRSSVENIVNEGQDSDLTQSKSNEVLCTRTSSLTDTLSAVLNATGSLEFNTLTVM